MGREVRSGAVGRRGHAGEGRGVRADQSVSAVDRWLRARQATCPLSAVPQYADWPVPEWCLEVDGDLHLPGRQGLPSHVPGLGAET